MAAMIAEFVCVISLLGEPNADYEPFAAEVPGQAREAFCARRRETGRRRRGPRDTDRVWRAATFASAGEHPVATGTHATAGRGGRLSACF